MGSKVLFVKCNDSWLWEQLESYREKRGFKRSEAIRYILAKYFSNQCPECGDWYTGNVCQCKKSERL